MNDLITPGGDPVDTRALRVSAYRNESDPLFFKWQRDEATKEQWLDKVEETRLRYPVS